MLSSSRGLAAVRACDPFHGFRSAINEAAFSKGDWAGVPVPIEGERLVVEPSYPWAHIFNRDEEPTEPPDPADVGWTLINRWYSGRHRCDILIMRDPEGRVVHGKWPAWHSIGHAMRTMGCSVAWGIEQEGRATQLLGTMLRHHAFKSYLLTGMFLEKSERSGLMYLFRKLRPTLALSPGPSRDWEATTGAPKILAALCMHPIAYYADSWAGAMCPTDDVIAHLALMRGDEAMFWRRCNQHPPYRPEAGL